MDERVRVECYAGYRSHERPVALVEKDGRRRRVGEVIARRREPEAEVFDVRLEDGARLRLRLDTRSGRWSAGSP